MSNVIFFPGKTALDISPKRVLDGAAAEGLESVVLVGRDADGELYFASSLGSTAETLWLLEAAKLDLLGGGA